MTGCATYSSKMEVSRDFYYAGEYENALSSIDGLIKKSADRDIYLYYLERGKIRIADGDYDSSIVDLQAAESRFREIEGTISVSEFFKSGLISDTRNEYQPEPHEMILINAYLLLDYWLKGDVEGAFIERNRVNNRLKQYTDGLSSGDWKLLDVPFARYLVALLYENEGLFDDAGIEYEEIRKIRPEAAPDGPLPGATEIAVFAELGRAPVKRSREIRGYLDYKDGKLFGFFLFPGVEEPLVFSTGVGGGFDLSDPGVIFTFAFPQYERQPRNAFYCKVVVDGVEAARAVTLDSIEDTAMEAFNKKLGMILLKAAFRTYLKTVAQTKLTGKKGEVADILAKVLSAVERADTRSWQTLPAEIGIFRMECEPGRHELFLNYYDENGGLLGRSRRVKLDVKEGGKEIVYFPGPS